VLPIFGGGGDNSKHIQLKSPETKTWREELFCSKWFNINDNIG
jgi:hypothetical protein